MNYIYAKNKHHRMISFIFIIALLIAGSSAFLSIKNDIMSIVTIIRSRLAFSKNLKTKDSVALPGRMFLDFMGFTPPKILRWFLL